MKRTVLGTSILASLLATAAIWAGSPVAEANANHAAQPDTNIGGNVRLPKVAIPAGGKLGDLLRKNAKISGGFDVIERRSIPSTLLRARSFSRDAWNSLGTDNVVLARVDGAQVHISLYELAKGNRPVVSRRYPASDIHRATNSFMNDVIAHYDREPGVFGSRIAYVRTRRNPIVSKNVQTVEMNGERPAAVTNNRSLNILPSVAPGGEVVFTSYAKRNPDLWLSAAGGSPKRISRYPGLNLGGTMSPDGRTIAVALSKDGNSEIYTMDRQGNIKARLTRNNAIDGSPAWSPDGRKIAFVSNRAGGPQVYTMSSNGGGASRVTKKGNYNQSPDWNHGTGRGNWIVYSGRDGSNRYDIFKVDVTSGRVVRMTQNPGRNLDPTWSPDGRMIAYSRAGGIFVANEDGNNNVQIVRGGSTPDWGNRVR